MRLYEERSVPAHAAERQAEQPMIQKSGSAPAISTHAPFPPLHAPASARSIGEGAPDAADEQMDSIEEAHIAAILRAMSLGHIVLGVGLAIGSVIMEAALGEPTFFGLAASGGMLGVCGLITILAANRQRASQSPLAFYLLPYADFAIVGLWLLLFSVSGSIVLFYAYVVVSAALLLGSRHAVALGVIAGATILAMSLGQYQHQITPAIMLSPEMQVAFTISSTVLALGLIAYVARLFSVNLDRFIAQTNRQRGELLRTRRRMAEQQEQAQREMEALSSTYVHFISGDTEARAPVSNGPLALAAHILNTLLDHMERLLRISAARSRMEERIGELIQAVERLCSGDATALQALGGPTETSLDTLTLALARAGRQLVLSQQALQHAAGGYTAVIGIAADLSLLCQTLSNTDSALQEMQTRSAQSAVHLRTLLENEGGYSENRSTERPFLREMELRARQQSAGLELLRARLGHIVAQLTSVETELRRTAEGMEQVSRAARPMRAGQAGPAGAPAASGALPGDAAANVQVRPASGPVQPLDSAHPAAPASPRPPSGGLRMSDAPPRRFNGPLASSARPTPEPLESWQTPFGRDDDSL